MNRNKQLEQIYREMPEDVRRRVGQMLSQDDEQFDEWLKSLKPCKRVAFKHPVAVGFGK